LPIFLNSKLQASELILLLVLQAERGDLVNVLVFLRKESRLKEVVERKTFRTPNINIKSVMMCINCAQMKRQIDNILSQLKSLQKITELLQQDNEASKMVNLGATADKGAAANYKEVKSAYPNNSSNIISKSHESDSYNVINDYEVLNLLNNARHQGNGGISSVNIESSSNVSTLNSKIIFSQVNSSVKWSDVAAGRV
jgi:hypothetical protein